jgi:hypothetical protein
MDLHGMHNKVWMKAFLFNGFLSFFKNLVPSGISHSNKYLLPLDSHSSHVTLKIIGQAQTFGLDMITLLSHTSHALQPLDVNCFKPFKTTFMKKRNSAMVKNNHCEPKKCTLARWVDKALE